MNAEYLLDAIGRLDDDLVQEAERYRRPKARYGRLLGLAASFAVVLLLGYGVTHLGMGGGAPGGGNGAAPSYSGADMAQGNNSGASIPSASENESPGEVLGQDAPTQSVPYSPGGANAETPGKSEDGSDTTIMLQGGALTISLWREGTMNRHTFLLRSGESQVLDEPPEGCVELGRLERLGENEEPNVPYTDDGEYAGCPVWLLMEDPETAVLYVELPEGGYLEFR